LELVVLASGFGVEVQGLEFGRCGLGFVAKGIGFRF
jgi:hypothetical protein